MRAIVSATTRLAVCIALATGPATAPAGAQTFATAGSTLPAPVVVRLPTTFGGRGVVASPFERVVPSGEYATRIHTESDRAALEDRIRAERFATQQALIAKRGAGTPIVLRKARY